MLLASLLGLSVWLIFLAIVFFPGAGPFGKNPFDIKLVLLSPVVGLFAYFRSGIGIALLPLAGIANVIVMTMLTKGIDGAISTICYVVTSALWIVLPYISLLLRPKSHGRKNHLHASIQEKR